MNFNVYRTFYSAFGLSSDINGLFELLQLFAVGGFTDNDTNSVDLLRMAKTLVNETKDEKVSPY